MDAITERGFRELSHEFPRHAIHFTHQFLDGRSGKPCGFVPHDWNGMVVTVSGQWCVDRPHLIITRSQNDPADLD